MPEPLSNPDVENLVQGYVEGSLTAAECLRLRELLRERPELVTLILSELRFDAMIRQEVLADESRVSADSLASGPNHVPSRTLPVPGHASRVHLMFRIFRVSRTLL